jgi:hypothetical protein
MAFPNPETSAKKLKEKERAIQALELRKAGASFAMIAGQLEYADESGARKAVKALMDKREYEAVNEARKLELERLDKMLLGDGKNGVYNQAVKGNFGAIDRVIKIMERRSKLLGLDASAKVETTGSIDVNVNDAKERLKHLLTRHAAESTAAGDPRPTDG